MSTKKANYFSEQVKNEEINILNYFSKICNNQRLKYYLIGGTLLGAVRHKGFIPWDDDIDVAMPRKDYNKFIKYFNKHRSEEFILDYYKTNSKYWLPMAKIRANNTEYVESFLKYYKKNQGIWIDIFPLDNGIKPNALIHKIQEKIIKSLKGILYIKNIKRIAECDTLIRKTIAILIKIFPNKLYHFLLNLNMQLVNWWPKSKYFINYGSQYGIKKQTHLKEKYEPSTFLMFETGEYVAPGNYEYVLSNIYGKDYMKLPPKDKRVTHNPIKVKLKNGEEYYYEKNL